MRKQKIRPDRTRRLIVKGFCAGIASSLFFGARLRGARAADAAKWPKDAFMQKTQADAIKALYGKDAEISDRVKLEAPEIAENGAVVPISVSSALPDITSIAVLVSENPFPLAAAYTIPAGTSGMVASRLKMAKTSTVVALVESNGKIYSASKEVKVTVGGCGG
jgi:sulfur-oxidizing protein SoxY